MSLRRNPIRQMLVAAVAAVVSLLLVGTALAVLPRAGRTYSGFTSAGAANGHKAPVSFTASSDRRRLLRFKWAGFGCVGGGGPGNPYADPYNIYKVGTIRVSAAGKFYVRNVKWTSTTQTPIKVTYSTVNGHFVTTRKATGVIRFTQKFQGHTCSGRVSFTAVMH